jgi:hypothetical protein
MSDAAGNIDVFERALVVDDRAGFYMVPSTSIARARTRLSGGHLTEALAGLVCLARESYAQHGASREDQQGCETNLDALATRILGVSRTRALRIVDNLVDAGALVKQAHRFDSTRGRLPTEITFVDRAVSFAYVSGAAFRALARAEDSGRPAFGPLALYLALVGLGGEQRNDFPTANRRMARASHPELARLSGLSVSSVKRALDTLKGCGLLVARPQPTDALKTKAIYRLIDPVEHAEAATPNGAPDMGAAAAAATAHSPIDRQATARPTTAHSDTDDSPQPDRWTARSRTDDSSEDDRSTAHSETDRQATEPIRAHVERQQMTEPQIKISSLAAQPTATGGEGQEIDQLLEAFCAWTRQALGERRFTALYDPSQWRHSAQQLLAQYDLERVLAGIDRLSRDALLADKATTLPTFALIADRAITRAAADRAYRAYRQPAADGPSWSDAFSAIRAAIRQHGEANKRNAREQLVAVHAAYGSFIDSVGWTALCRDAPERHEYDWKRAWEQACAAITQEAAA